MLWHRVSSTLKVHREREEAAAAKIVKYSLLHKYRILFWCSTEHSCVLTICDIWNPSMPSKQNEQVAFGEHGKYDREYVYCTRDVTRLSQLYAAVCYRTRSFRAREHPRRVQPKSHETETCDSRRLQ